MYERVYTQTFGVIAAIIEKDGKILLVQEALGKDKGKWNQPAGWIDPGENPLEAVQREVKEETGYDFKPTGLLGVYSIVRHRLKEHVPVGIPHGIAIVFVGEIGNHTDEFHHDVSATNWFTPEEIYAMDENTLRDADIKDEVRRFLKGARYPLELLHHTGEN